MDYRFISSWAISYMGYEVRLVMVYGCMGYGLWTIDFGLWVMGFRFLVFGLWSYELMRFMGYGLMA